MPVSKRWKILSVFLCLIVVLGGVWYFLVSRESKLPPSVLPSPAADMDGDGLSDYDEQFKYGTSRLKADSDEDGIPDNDWNERREYTATIWAIMRISQPYRIVDMNNFYQDIRVIEERNGHLTFEVVIYPEARHPIVPTSLDRLNYPIEVTRYLESSATSDISTEMRETMNGVVEGATTDVEVVERIWKWNNENMKVNESWIGIPYSQVLRITASEMFRVRQTRLSTTRAVLLAAELRAVGIPTRIKQQVFAIPDPSWSETTMTSHPQNEVYLQGIGQWVTLDYQAFLGLNPDRSNHHYRSLVVTAVTDDLSNLGFSPWTTEWTGNSENLYKTIELREEKARY